MSGVVTTVTGAVASPVWSGGPTGSGFGAAGGGVLAASLDELVDRWHDMGPILWVAAGAAAVLWAIAYAAVWAVTEPRAVEPGPETLELGGDETPAVVNLLTSDWELGHEAVSATLLDLAARRHVEIDQVGDRTFVRRRGRRTGRDDPLTGYETMVLDHVRRLAGEADDGAVPAEALTTGPGVHADRWWRTFGQAVEAHARDLGLARHRWSRGLKTGLVALAVVVGVAVTMASSATFEDDPTDPDDDPITGAISTGVVSFGMLSVVVAKSGGQRDTPAGRASAARWLGLRELLADDPLFAEHPPAGVAIWDRHLAHGAALGVAHGAVAALPLGAESETEAWSPASGRWRMVHIRYPRRIPPGYGRHPALVLVLGAVLAVVGFRVVPVALGLADALVDTLGTGAADGDPTPAGLRVGVSVTVAAVAGVLGSIGVVGTWMALFGLADLVGGRRTIEGRVLRRRVRSTGEDETATWLAVDDGTSDRVRAWRLSGHPVGSPGQTVRAEVTARLRHVRALQVVPAAGTVPDGAGLGTGAAAGDPGAARAGDPGAAGTGAGGTGVPGVPAIPAIPGVTSVPGLGAGLGGLATALGGLVAPPSDPSRATGAPIAGGTGAPAPPPLPPPDAVAGAARLPLRADPRAAPHPLALPGASGTLTDGGHGRVVLAWVRPEVLDAQRALPGFVRTPVPGLGDEAFRLRAGGGVVARSGAHVLSVTAHLPDATDAERDRVTHAVAQLAVGAAATWASAAQRHR